MDNDTIKAIALVWMVFKELLIVLALLHYLGAI